MPHIVLVHKVVKQSFKMAVLRMRRSRQRGTDEFHFGRYVNRHCAEYREKGYKKIGKLAAVCKDLIPIHSVCKVLLAEVGPYK